MALISPSTSLSSSSMLGSPPFRGGPRLHAQDSVSIWDNTRVMHIIKCSSSNKDDATPILQESTAERNTKQLVEPSRANIEGEAPSEQQPILGSKTGNRSLISLFAFDGAAPETINGRMAMVGFVWALVAEKLTGLTVVEQLFNPSTSGLLWFGAVVPLFTFASIIPLTNSTSESTDARRWGLFNAKAERWNGRLAMIGFAALLLVEIVRQAPIIHI